MWTQEQIYMLEFNGMAWTLANNKSELCEVHYYQVLRNYFSISTRKWLTLNIKNSNVAKEY